LSSAIHTAIAQVLGAPIRVEFAADAIAQPTVPQRRPRPAPLLEPLEVALHHLDRPDPHEPRPELPLRARGSSPAPAGSPLSPRDTVGSLVVRQSTRVAHAASLAIVDRPGSAYNPLFRYGGVGLGKARLLHAIGHAVAEKGGDVVYVSAETFTNELIESI